MRKKGKKSVVTDQGVRIMKYVSFSCFQMDACICNMYIKIYT